MWEVHYEWELAPWEPEDNVFLAWAFGELMDIVQSRDLRMRWLSISPGITEAEINEKVVLDWRTHLNLLDCKREDLTPELATKRDHVASWAEEASAAIGRAAYSGRLATRCRDMKGGPLMDVPPGFWGINDFWPRFAASALNYDNPYQEDAPPTHWIFVDGDQLNDLVDDLRRLYGQEPIWGSRVQQAEPTVDAPAEGNVAGTATPEKPAKVGRGRKPGVGGFALKDAPIVEEMVQIVRDEKCSPWAAATKLLPKIDGHTNNDEGRVRRVVTRYYRRYDDIGQAKPATA